MEEWKNFIGKEIKIIFEDGDNHFSKKQGTLDSVTDTHLILFVLNHREGFLLTKILRFEEVEL